MGFKYHTNTLRNQTSLSGKIYGIKFKNKLQEENPKSVEIKILQIMMEMNAEIRKQQDSVISI